MLYTSEYQSPVGRLTLVGNEGSLVGLWMEGQKYFAATLEEAPVRREETPVLQAARGWLDRYFAREKPGAMELPLAPQGSPFRRKVWDILCRIPYGQVTTYGAIAEKMAVELGKKTMSAQAVGGAVGHNPISIIIPCHRVVGAGGSLTGYAGGIQKKVALLQLEGADLSALWVPTEGTAIGCTE